MTIFVQTKALVTKMSAEQNKKNTDKRALKIINDFNKSKKPPSKNVKRLAEKYGYSERTIWRYLQR